MNYKQESENMKVMKLSSVCVHKEMNFYYLAEVSKLLSEFF